MQIRNQIKTAKPKTAGVWDYFSLGLTAFGGLGMEVVYAYFLEPFVYDAPMQEWTPVQTIIHWICICITWGIFGIWLLRECKEKYNVNLWASSRPMKVWQIAAVFLFIITAVAINALEWGGLKVICEYRNKGFLLFAFQYIYYAFETVLFMMIIIFGQMACECWLDDSFPIQLHGKIPYGGIVCGLTWGLAHIFTKGSLLSGFNGILWGAMMGSAYILVNKDIRKAWAVMFLMFAF